MRLLLVNPRYPESFWSYRWAVDSILPAKRAINPPLGLATVAALTPEHWQVAIVDENVESIPLAPEADVIGVCGMGVQFERQSELLAYYRRAGYRVVAGGSFASLCPERYAGLADVVVAGESEYLWPRVCADLERGEARALYREDASVDLSDSPTPRFDLLKLGRYSTATMQFSRGCPYRCDFCDIIVMFGRKPRHKSLAQVGRELDALRAAGAKNVFFVDDNLIGNRRVALDLLAFLADYQKRHGDPFDFGTEVSINLAQDAELLAGFREARFSWVFIGIESPDPEALREAGKTQNLREDPLVALRRIYAHGIDVLAGFIVGFDRDTLETFDRQYRFIVDSGIQAAMVGLLTALPKTPLYERLEKAGRLRETAHGASDNTKPSTNVQPLNMEYGAMVEAYETLYRRLTSDAAIAARIRNKLRWMGNPVYRGEYSLPDRVRIVRRLLVRGILPGGPRRLFHFARTLATPPRGWPTAIVDWIAGLAMRDYVERHFGRGDDPGACDKLVARLRRVVERHRGSAAVSVRTRSPAPSVLLRLRGELPESFFAGAARPLERLLAKTRATLTLSVEALRESEGEPLERLLARLRRHGDRVSVVLDRRLREIVAVDSSVFRLVLE